ncbi:MAG: tripartite tricarboxylate transporter permease [Treponemataceae bacterium]
MDIFSNLALGFATAFTPINLLYAFIGCFLGTLIGVLPGIGPVATISMLLPATFGLDPTTALIMLAGIYYGAAYGGSTTAILVNIPGESSSVVTAIDGYKMALQGRAGVALVTAALGSFFAGCVATLILAAFSVPLSKLALKFGPADYFSLMVLGLVGAVVLSSGSVVKAVSMVLIGLLLGLVGADVNSGVSRFTFGIAPLYDGIDFVCVAMGLFGFAEVISNLGHSGQLRASARSIKNMWPSREDFKRMVAPILRGTALGSLLGVLPGGGATIASFASYTLEKKVSKHSTEFGHGAIEGVAGPEAANNAASQTSFIPLLTLGIPPNAVMALMVGAMTIHNIQPGPLVMSSNPQLFWGLIASMWIGNLMLVVLNLPLIGIWVKLLTIPYRFLYPAILMFCCIGVYSLANSSFNLYVTIVFTLLGVLFRWLDCEVAPLLLGFVLGPMMEENFGRALLLAKGDYTVFVARPISAVLLAATVLLIIVIVVPAVRKTREVAFDEPE